MYNHKRYAVFSRRAGEFRVTEHFVQSLICFPLIVCGDKVHYSLTQFKTPALITKTVIQLFTLILLAVSYHFYYHYQRTLV